MKVKSKVLNLKNDPKAPINIGGEIAYLKKDQITCGLSRLTLMPGSIQFVLCNSVNSFKYIVGVKVFI